VIVTHEDHIAQMASRIIRLEDGVLVSDGPSRRGGA
jgi:ABC-type lipoprotein export system ATPase subunit